GDTERARELAREAWDLVRGRDAGDKHVKEFWHVAREKVRIGVNLRTIGMVTEAEQLLLVAHATLLAQVGPRQKDTLDAAAALRELYTSLGRTAEAAAYAGEKSQ